MERINLDKKNLRRFGITMGAAFFIIGLLLIIKHKHNPLALFLISAILCICALTVPRALKPLYVAWMKLAFILSWMNTRIILFIIFYLIFTPIGIIMRLFGVDLIKRKIDMDRDSYWQKALKKPFDRLSYEKQF